jgi:hemolysin activation/secretion protein
MRVGYSVPVLSHGWRVGVNASHFSYKIIADEFKPLDAHGDSNAFGFETSYPLIRARLHNVYASFAIDQKSFNNKSMGATTTDYKIQTATLGFSGNVFDDFAGGGASTATLSFVAGKVNLDGSPNQTVDALTTKTAGSYNKVQLSIARLQTVTDHFSVYASVSDQVASKNLDSSEKFYLGGASGVRAYPANEGGGSEGWLFNLEGRVRLSPKFNLTGFYDHGSVKVNKDNDIIGAADPNSYALKGVGLSLAWRANIGLSLKATVAHRISSNSNATIAGNDQDGSLIKNRFWIQAALPF